MIFEDWALSWLETYKKGLVKDNSYWGTYYNPVVVHLIPYFGHMKLDAIKSIEIQAYFKSKKDIYSLETLKKDRACLAAIFDTAIDNELCKKNPVTKNIKIVSSIQPQKRLAYTDEEYKIVYEYAKTHIYGLDILVLLETGISRSELLGIRWENLDCNNRVIHINQAIISTKNTSTGKWNIVADGLKNEYRERSIPISETLMRRIIMKPRVITVKGNAKKGSPPFRVKTEYVFYSPTGKIFSPDNWYNRRYKVFMEDMHRAYPHIPIRNPHELRHTRATLWWENDVDLLSIAFLGGWTDLEMLRKRYAHVSLEKLKEVLKR